jgi:hypothetical protein
MPLSAMTITDDHKLTITEDDIRRARRRVRRESKIAYIQKRLNIKGSLVPVSGMASHPHPAQRADWYRTLLKALRGRRFDDNKGRSQVIFLSSDPRAPVLVTPELVENMVGVYGDKIDDVDPCGERDAKNSPIVRSFLSKCWIRKGEYQQWDTGAYGAATRTLKWGFDDPSGRFNRDDEMIVPVYLQKARDKLRGLDRKAWPGVVKMDRLLEMGWAKSINEAARFIEQWEPLGNSTYKNAHIDRLRKLCARLQKECAKGPA